MIAEQEIQRAAPLAHRHTLTAGVVVFDHRAGAAGPLVVGADVVNGHAVQHGFDAVAVPSLRSGQAAIIDEAGIVALLFQLILAHLWSSKWGKLSHPISLKY